jgi:hypothetical protein
MDSDRNDSASDALNSDEDEQISESSEQSSESSQQGSSEGDSGDIQQQPAAPPRGQAAPPRSQGSDHGQGGGEEDQEQQVDSQEQRLGSQEPEGSQQRPSAAAPSSRRHRGSASTAFVRDRVKRARQGQHISAAVAKLLSQYQQQCGGNFLLLMEHDSMARSFSTPALRQFVGQGPTGLIAAAAASIMASNKQLSYVRMSGQLRRPTLAQLPPHARSVMLEVLLEAVLPSWSRLVPYGCSDALLQQHLPFWPEGEEWKPFGE